MLCMHAAKVQMREGRSHRIGWMARRSCHARRLWGFDEEDSPTARTAAGGGGRQVLQDDGMAVPSHRDVRGGLIQMRAYLIWQAKPQGEAT